MARLFISHSSKDNFEAIAFAEWLVREGWSEQDILLDLHDAISNPGATASRRPRPARMPRPPRDRRERR